ncbi:MAG: hypothetical protein QOH71_750 [Blastocatellia bacterium]|jgi:uncharacterized protein with HEPN domain|nr:hypothetical protein [Blastocatellia bacterium]
MNVETKRRLLDALEACQAIQQFSAGIDFNAFLADEMRQAALERKFEILGEALNRAEQSDPELGDRLPELRRIIGMRNRIIHGYDAVDEEILWDAVQFKIPLLTEQVLVALREAGEDV